MYNSLYFVKTFSLLMKVKHLETNLQLLGIMCDYPVTQILKNSIFLVTDHGSDYRSLTVLIKRVELCTFFYFLNFMKLIKS